MDTPLDVRRDGAITVITLNRPEALNALNAELLRNLCRALVEADADPAIGAIVLTGAGDRAFTAGMDLKEAAERLDDFGPDAQPAATLAACRTPVVVAVNGLCITCGMELMMACDVVYASNTARFADTHVRLGLLPGWGISQRMARQIGPQRAKEISLSGRFVDAARATEIGLVNRVVEPAHLMPTTLELAREIAGHPVEAVQGYKALIDEGYAMGLDQALVMEHDRSVAHIRSMSSQHLQTSRAAVTTRNRAATAD
ncbi:MAG: enoyl-CoA hydratase [Marmoricola sp.]